MLWALSTDDLELHERMAKSYALSFPLLADEGGKVAAEYGVRSLLGSARRSIFIVDRNQAIRWTWIASREQPQPDYDLVIDEAKKVAAEA